MVAAIPMAVAAIPMAVAAIPMPVAAIPMPVAAIPMVGRCYTDAGRCYTDGRSLLSRRKNFFGSSFKYQNLTVSKISFLVIVHLLTIFCSLS